MVIVYRILFLPALLLLLPKYLLRMWRRGGYREGFAHRFGILKDVPPRRKAVRRIWIQAVSVGEILAVIPLLKRLAARDDVEVVLTTTTSTGFALAKERLAELTVWQGIFPLDFVPFSARTFRRLQPDLTVLMEGELWPEHIHQARRRSIPVVLINGRLSDRSFRRHHRLRRWTTAWFRHLAAILAGSETDQERFQALGWLPADKVRLTGNLKLDVDVEAQLDAESCQQLLNEAGFSGGEPPQILLGSSTWPGEEKALLRAYARLRESFPQLRLLLVPRHAERRGEIRIVVEEAGFPFHFRSTGTAAAPGNKVYVADTTGELRRLTELADVVFIGKSLPPNAGGQTPVEAAALGKPLLFGPEMSNFRDIARRLTKDGAARTVASDGELTKAVRELLQNPEERTAMGRRARAFIESSRGATARTAAALLDLLPPG
ncbi:MAG: glycosyltransferase [Verrucomicrobia bacterium]|jgi:3-deoxy-D-manno-octulosonic-acid transferase|nr:glycosyltransferase [Verrucomicrobiota bacterium]